MKTPPIFALIALTANALAQDAPRVTSTQPADGAMDIAPGAAEIVVTFDQDMDRAGFSFVGGGPTFPKVRGTPSWRSARECVLPVELGAGQSYAVGINDAQHTNFKSARGIAATPATLRFTTRASAVTNAEAAQRLREAIETRYSHRDVHLANWSTFWPQLEPRLLAAKSPREFAEIAGRGLSVASDPHIWLDVNGELVASFRRQVAPNVLPAIVARTMPKWSAKNPIVETGWPAPRVGYIAIHSWERKHGRETFEAALTALDQMRDASAIIVDVRLNSGGDELIAREFAACFVERRTLYARHATLEPGGFGTPVERWIEPSSSHPRYTGKVAVLIGPANMSSAEAFILMMRHAAHATLIGQRTFGSSGNPQPHALGNGVTIFLPSWKETAPDGAVIEGRGIAPDIEASINLRAPRDAVIDAALRHFGATR